MSRNQEELEELRQDMLQDARIDDLIENDYDFFLDYYDSDITELTELYYSVKNLHEKNGWDFDLQDVLK